MKRGGGKGSVGGRAGERVDEEDSKRMKRQEKGASRSKGVKDVRRERKGGRERQRWGMER